MSSPESRCDALHRNPLDSNDLRAWRSLAYDLERQHSLAQTEIKGHMRIIDDLKADLADEAPARFQLQGALKRAQDEWEKAQARIAALEKALDGWMLWYPDCAQLLDGWHADTAWTEWDSGVRKRLIELGAESIAALKVRA